jgi:hypothetical protein
MDSILKGYKHGELMLLHSHVSVHKQTADQLTAFDPNYIPPWDALSCADSLSDCADASLLDDPYAALGDDGIDGYSGADTVLDGSHDHALMLVGFALLEVTDDNE